MLIITIMSSDSDTPDTTVDVNDQEKVSKAIKNFISGQNENGDGTKTSTGHSGAGKKFNNRRDVIKAPTNLQTN